MSAGILDHAMAAYHSGLCVLAPKEDGTKAPGADWKRYQVTRPTEAEVRAMYSNGRTGLGVVCGKVSGGLEMFEFEGRAIDAGVADAFIDAADACGLRPLVDRIAEGYTEATPSGGLHWLFRTTSPVTTKLARRPATEEELAEDPDNRVKPLIETKGEGGFTITAPSYGTVHPTGQPWKLITGGFATIATISHEEHQALHDLARTFDQMPRPAVRVGEKRSSAESAVDSRPGDDYNARTNTSVYSVERVDDTVKTIAHLSERIPRQTLADAQLLQAYVEGSLREGVELALEDQIVNGDGTGENLLGIDDTPNIQQQAWATNILITTRKALTKLETVQIPGGAFVLTPADWETIELFADSTGDFIMGDQVPVNRAQRTLWGQPVVTSTTVDTGKGFLVDFAGSTQLWEREGVRIDWSEASYDPAFDRGAGVLGAVDFERNLIRFRAEGRWGFAVTRPAGVVEIDTAA